MRGEHTVLNHVQRIQPGHVVAFERNGDRRHVSTVSWHEDLSDLSDITTEEAADEFLHLFRRAIQERMIGESVAAHLSGGMDSSSVVCLAREMTGESVRPSLTTLSLTYAFPRLTGEKSYMQDVIDQGGPVAPQFLEGEAALDFDWFDKPIPAHDEPFAGLFQIGCERLIINSAREAGASVILAGGGEEILLRNSRFHLADRLRSGQLRALLAEARAYAASGGGSTWSVIKQHALEPWIPTRLQGGLRTWLRGGYSQCRTSL